MTPNVRFIKETTFGSERVNVDLEEKAPLVEITVTERKAATHPLTTISRKRTQMVEEKKVKVIPE